MRCIWTVSRLSIAVALLPLLACAAPRATGPVAGADQKPGPGGAELYKADAVHSSIGFRIKHLNVAYFYGRFNDVEGTFAFDEAEPARSVVDLHVKVESIDTHNGLRDADLKSAQFFDAGKFKEIAFRGTRTTRIDPQRFKVEGELTLHGVTRPLTVTLKRTGSGPGMRNEYRSGFETVFEVKRSEFGMTAMPDKLGDEVRLTVSIEGIRQ